MLEPEKSEMAGSAFNNDLEEKTGFTLKLCSKILFV